MKTRQGILIAIAVLLAAASLWGTYRWSEKYFLFEVAEQGRNSLNLYAETIRGWLGRYQSLPRVYAQNPHVTALLLDPHSQENTARVNDFLSEWNLATGAADTYLLDPNGTTLAASNWDQQVSFMGKNYAFRPYFKQAMQGRLGRFFGLGTASKKRGYYFSYPVRSDGQVIGSTIVKVGVGEIEQKLENSSHQVFVSDTNGVILLAGNPDWRLKSLAPLDEAARADILQIRQFELPELTAIGDFGAALHGGNEQVVVAPSGPGESPRELLHLSLPMAIEDWRLHILINTSFARNQVWTTVFLVGLALLGIALIATILWQRRQRLVERLRAREEARATLEKTVQDRTADLRASNLQLAAEVNERRAAEKELRHTQNELVQAGKLAALGQMSAALSHEFNQPLAAIRTYAENAGLLFDRGREEEARENMDHVVGLTERMAGLSKHLSSFARKPKDSVRAVSLNVALNESLELLKGRIEAAHVQLETTIPVETLWVQGGHIRLQQVIINLISNALDATSGQSTPQLKIDLKQDGDNVILVVEDNGKGLPKDSASQIFDPFFTTKEVGEGIGLGLSISYNIIKDFGGTIAACNRPAEGAQFTLTLKAAENPQQQKLPGKAAE